MAEDLSFPYRLYPTNTFGGSSMESPYISSDYNSEALRLLDFIVRINSSEQMNNTLNVFIIGSLIDDEEDGDSRTFNIKHIIGQHSPIFLLNYLYKNRKEKLNKPVRIIVISPSLNKLVGPIFIKKSNMLFGWQQPDPDILSYVSTKFEHLTYDFFNCPLPEYIKSDFLLTADKIEFFQKDTTNRLPQFYFRRRFYKNFFKFNRESREFEIKSLESMSIDDRQLYNQFGTNMIKSFTNNQDIIFVRTFYFELEKLINSTISKNGGNLCLNYSVFRDQWAGVGPNYFINTFNEMFSDNVLILSYSWRRSLVTILMEGNGKIILYDNSNYILKLIQDPKYVGIFDSERRIRYNVHNEDKKKKKDKNIVRADGIDFDIKKIKSNGDCMFNAVIKQINTNDNSNNLRQKVVSYIQSKPEMIDEIMDNIRGEGIYATYINKLEEEGIPEHEINKRLEDLYFYFILNNQNDSNSEETRHAFNLPLTVYYGGQIELKAISKLYNININVIRGGDENIIINRNDFQVDDPLSEIYIREMGQHFDIAIPLNSFI
jgi:hypothetical protein